MLIDLCFVLGRLSKYLLSDRIVASESSTVVKKNRREIEILPLPAGVDSPVGGKPCTPVLAPPVL